MIFKKKTATKRPRKKPAGVHTSIRLSKENNAIIEAAAADVGLSKYAFIQQTLNDKAAEIINKGVPKLTPKDHENILLMILEMVCHSDAELLFYNAGDGKIKMREWKHKHHENILYEISILHKIHHQNRIKNVDWSNSQYLNAVLNEYNRERNNGE